MDLGPGPARWPFTLEKRYLDVLLPDGGVLLVYLGWLRLFGLRRARVTADLFWPGEPARRGAAAAGAVQGGEGWLDYGAARIERERLTFAAGGLSGQLDFAARAPPAALGAPLLAVGGRRLDWIVEVPDADVAGEVRWPGGSLAVRGRGYRDLVRLDLPPWRFPIQELRWGRVAAGPHAATWMEARTRDGELCAGWRDGRPERRPDLAAALGPSRLLLEARVADLPGLGLGPMRWLLRRLSGDPHEAKWAAPGCIDGCAGVAVHEVVRWR